MILRNVAQSLTGEAAIWWRGHHRFVRSVEALEQSVRARFDPETKDDRAVIRAVQNRRQGKEEFLLAYIDDMLQLMERVHGHWTESEQVELIVDGLNDTFTPYFSIHDFIDIKQMVDYANKITSKTKRKKMITTEKPTEWRGPRRNTSVHVLEEAENVDNSTDDEEEELEKMYQFVDAVRQNHQKPVVSKKISKPQVDQADSATKQVQYQKERLPNELTRDQIYNGTVGDRAVRCHNCLMWGHNHLICPYERRIYCYGCGKPGVHLDKCATCQNRPNRPPAIQQAKNGLPERTSASLTPAQ